MIRSRVYSVNLADRDDSCLKTSRLRRMSDEELLIDLMRAYQNGSRDAFEKLYRCLKTPLYGFLLAHILNKSRAEDLLQESFLQIHRSRATYIPGKPVLPWAFGVARNVLLMDRRARRVRGRKEEADDRCVLDIPVWGDFDRILNRELLSQALKRIQPEQREAVLLHHFFGFSFREIGSLLGIRSGTARVRAHRGLASLKELIEPAVGKDKKEA